MFLDSIFSTCNTKSVAYPYLAILLLLFFSWVYFTHFKKTFITNIAFIAIVLGGVLNTLEWLFRGCVLDYIRFFNISFYNINDLLIMVGLVILFTKVIYERK